MKLFWLFFTAVISNNAMSRIFICQQLPTEHVIESDVLIKSHDIGFGFQYILTTPKTFKGLEFESAVVQELNGDDIKLFFSPHMTGTDEQMDLSSVMISHKKLTNTKLYVDYGNTCSGSGYRVIYTLSPLEIEDY